MVRTRVSPGGGRRGRAAVVLWQPRETLEELLTDIQPKVLSKSQGLAMRFAMRARRAFLLFCKLCVRGELAHRFEVGRHDDPGKVVGHLAETARNASQFALVST